MKSILINLLNIIICTIIYLILIFNLLIVDYVIYDNLPHYNILIIIHLITSFIISSYAAIFSANVAYEFLECLGYKKYTLTYKLEKQKETNAKIKRDMELAHYYNY